MTITRQTLCPSSELPPCEKAQKPSPSPATVLGYCGICRELFEYVVPSEGGLDIRCPLCGFRHAEV